MRYDVAVRSAFESNTTLSVVLLAILQEQFGPEVHFWDPTTVFLEIKDEWRAEPSTEVMDRISAGQLAVSTDQFFNDVSAFFNVCNTLSSGQPSFSVFDPVEPEEMAWAIVEISLMRELQSFAPMIRDYTRLMLERDGYSGEDYPEVFHYVLTREVPGHRTLLGEIEHSLHDEQKDAVEDYINAKLRDLIYQFDKIPGLDKTLTELMKVKDLEDLSKLEV